MSKYVKTYVTAFILAFAVAAIVISIQNSRMNKILEGNFESLHERTCKSLIEHGYNRYVLQENEDIAAAIETINGAPLTEEEKYEQFCCYITNVNAGVNSSDIDSPLVGGVAAADVHAYYDSEMNSIMKYNSLMLVRKLSNDQLSSDSKDASKAMVYYTYQDESLTEQMNMIIKEYGNKIGKVVFHVRGGYIKDHEFVPAKLSFYSMGEGGVKSKEKELYTTAEDREAMEADGYSYYEIDDSFLIGDTKDDSDSFVVYCGEIDSDRQSRVDELIAESKKLKGASEGGRLFVRKKAGVFTNEYFSIDEINLEGEEDVFYAVTYEKMNFLFDLMSYSLMGGHGLLYVVLIIAEIIGAVVLAVAGGSIYLYVTRHRA